MYLSESCQTSWTQNSQLVSSSGKLCFRDENICRIRNLILMFAVFQFGSLLDDNAGSKFDNIGLNAMANTDKAGERTSCSVHRDNH